MKPVKSNVYCLWCKKKHKLNILTRVYEKCVFDWDFHSHLIVHDMKNSFNAKSVQRAHSVRKYLRIMHSSSYISGIMVLLLGAILSAKF